MESQCRLVTRLLGSVAAVLGTFLVAGGDVWSEEVRYKLFEREAFAVEIPDWPVVTDEGRPDLGQYRVASTSGGYFVEVVWRAEDPAGLVEDELRSVVQAVLNTDLIQGEIVDEGRSDEKLWVKGAAAVARDRMNLSSITCLRTGVTVTLGVFGVEQKTVQDIHERAFDSLACRGDDPAAFNVQLMATTSFGEEFGYYREGELVLLTDAPGRTFVVLESTSQAVQLVPQQPDFLAGIFGNLLESEIELLGRPTPQESTKGESQVVVRGNKVPAAEPIVFGALDCPDSSGGYLILAWDSGGNTGHKGLTQLIRNINCPGSGNPDYDQLETACAVGAEMFCP